jgi:hypothetical protein
MHKWLVGGAAVLGLLWLNGVFDTRSTAPRQQQRQTQQRSSSFGYDECVRTGASPSNCSFMAGLNRQMSTLNDDLREIERLGDLCHRRGQRAACRDLDALMARSAAAAARAEVMGNAAAASGRIFNGVRASEQRVQDRQTASQYRMEGWRHEQAASRADAAGHRRAADQHRYEANRKYGRAQEYQPRSSWWRPW